jgi:transposase
VHRVQKAVSPKRVAWLVNPAHIKAVPGRKTDVRDSEWIAQLLMHGLMSSSFIPDAAQTELRELTRYRKRRVCEQASESNRVIKLLESSNIKLASVASDVLGKSGRAMIEALLEGAKSIEQIADLAKGRLKAKRVELIRALDGVLSDTVKFLLRQMLDHMDAIDKTLASIDERIAALLEPAGSNVELLVEVPGINALTAAGILAEVGGDMSVFPSADHLASWAGLSPGSNESAGKRKRTPTRKGSHWLRVHLIQAAWAASRTKASFWMRKFHQLRARSNPTVALVAIARKMIVAIYYILRDHVHYKELGADYVPHDQPERRAKRLVRQLNALGFAVQLAAVPSEP